MSAPMRLVRSGIFARDLTIQLIALTIDGVRLYVIPDGAHDEAERILRMLQDADLAEIHGSGGWTATTELLAMMEDELEAMVGRMVVLGRCYL